ncbi:MAG: preprotein translocase subunit YajC [Sphaerochaetaceae bacterium]|nr:preprotein translocase subunit YajC [Sphaerochaetaceae bacterium]
MHALLAAMAAPATDASSGSSMMVTLVTFGMIILIFYFLIIRPQKKRDREAKDMLAAIKKGDKIQSIGGIRGTVVSVKESSVIVKVDDNTRIEFAKNAISTVLDKKPEAAPSKKKAASEEKVEKVEAPSKKDKKAKAAEEAVEVVEEAVVEEASAEAGEKAAEAPASEEKK